MAAISASTVTWSTAPPASLRSTATPSSPKSFASVSGKSRAALNTRFASTMGNPHVTSSNVENSFTTRFVMPCATSVSAYPNAFSPSGFRNNRVSTSTSRRFLIRRLRKTFRFTASRNAARLRIFLNKRMTRTSGSFLSDSRRRMKWYVIAGTFTKALVPNFATSTCMPSPYVAASTACRIVSRTERMTYRTCHRNVLRRTSCFTKAYFFFSRSSWIAPPSYDMRTAFMSAVARYPRPTGCVAYEPSREPNTVPSENVSVSGRTRARVAAPPAASNGERREKPFPV